MGSVRVFLFCDAKVRRFSANGYTLRAKNLLFSINIDKYQATCHSPSGKTGLWAGQPDRVFCLAAHGARQGCKRCLSAAERRRTGRRHKTAQALNGLRTWRKGGRRTPEGRDGYCPMSFHSHTPRMPWVMCTRTNRYSRPMGSVCGERFCTSGCPPHTSHWMPSAEPSST